MAQVIIIEKNERLRDLLSIQLKQQLNVEVIPRENSDEAIAILSILPEIDLVISRHFIADEPTGDLIYQYIKSSNLDTNIIILDKNEATFSDDDILYINEPEKNWKEIIKISANCMGLKSNINNNNLSQSRFVAVDVKYFLYLDTSCCDAFIRIKKSPSEYQFVKRIHKNDTYSKSAIARYIAQGLNHFYIPNKQRVFFTNYMSDILLDKIENINFTEKKNLGLLDTSYQIAKKEIIKYGFTTATVQLTEAILSSMVSSINSNMMMSSLLGNILTSETSFLYQHSHLTSLIGVEMLKGIGIDDDHQHIKIVHASFFSDMTLSDDEDLAKIMTYKELEDAVIPEDEWDLVFNHAFEASILYSKFPEGILGVSEIIKQHHGTQNGKGYSVDSEGKLKGISKIFLVAYEFSKYLLDIKSENKKIIPIINKFKERYTDPEILNAVKSLENVLRKKQSEFRKK